MWPVTGIVSNQVITEQDAWEEGLRHKRHIRPNGVRAHTRTAGPHREF